MEEGQPSLLTQTSLNSHRPQEGDQGPSSLTGLTTLRIFPYGDDPDLRRSSCDFADTKPGIGQRNTRSGYQNTPDLYQIMTMHMHEQAPSTKGPEPHNRPLSTSAPGTSHSKWPRSFRCLRMILDQPRLQQTPVGKRFSLTAFSKAQPPPLREGS